MHECQQDTRIALMEQKMGMMDEKIDKILNSVVGNGKPGFNIRLDRLERNLWLVFAVGTFAGGIGGYIIKGLL